MAQHSWMHRPQRSWTRHLQHSWTHHLPRKEDPICPGSADATLVVRARCLDRVRPYRYAQSSILIGAASPVVPARVSHRSLWTVRSWITHFSLSKLPILEQAQI